MSTPNSRVFRDVLAHFASGVTIVTGATPEGPVGFTCQSFSSLSVDPPLVVVLPSLSSTSWPPIAATGRFCVTVLAAGQEELSSAFAVSGGDKFAGVDWTPAPSGAPVLTGGSAWIDCRIRAVYGGGDHAIVVGHVEDLGSDERVPLLFHRGRYAGVRTAA